MNIFEERLKLGFDDFGTKAPPKPPAHINKYLLQRDGDMWMCADISFINIQESLCAFGKTPNEAMDLFMDLELARLKDEVGL